MMNEIMTIEEAINALIGLKDYYNDENEDSYIGFDDADNKALDMAIRALEVIQFMEEVFLQELPGLDMRDATEEERSSLNHYIDSISKSTGVKFDFNGVKTELEPCEDCVSRQEFEKRIKPYDTDDKMDKALYNFAHNILISCTPVKPQRPKGEWIEQTDKNKKLYGWFYCSECGAVLGRVDGANYCSECGAEMEGSNE